MAFTPCPTTCKHCQKGFVKRSHNALFCSNRCKLRWSTEFGTRLHMQAEYSRTKREKYARNESMRKMIVEKAREYRAAHPDRISDSDFRYRSKNREKKAQTSLEWHAANKSRANVRRMVRKQAERSNAPWATVIKGAKSRAKKRSLPFDLTIEWARDRWTGRCELTGLPFTIGLRGVGAKMFSPSIDKIDPILGYTQSNCRIILWCVNAFKYNGTDEQVFMVAEALMKAKAKQDDSEREELAA